MDKSSLRIRRTAPHCELGKASNKLLSSTKFRLLLKQCLSVTVLLKLVSNVLISLSRLLWTVVLWMDSALTRKYAERAAAYQRLENGDRASCTHCGVEMVWKAGQDNQGTVDRWTFCGWTEGFL